MTGWSHWVIFTGCGQWLEFLSALWYCIGNLVCKTLLQLSQRLPFYAQSGVSSKSMLFKQKHSVFSITLQTIRVSFLDCWSGNRAWRLSHVVYVSVADVRLATRNGGWYSVSGMMPLETEEYQPPLRVASVTSVIET